MAFLLKQGLLFRSFNWEMSAFNILLGWSYIHKKVNIDFVLFSLLCFIFSAVRQTFWTYLTSISCVYIFKYYEKKIIEHEKPCLELYVNNKQSYYLTVVFIFSIFSFLLKVPERYEKCLWVSSSVKGKPLAAPPSGREWATSYTANVGGTEWIPG